MELNARQPSNILKKTILENYRMSIKKTVVIVLLVGTAFTASYFLLTNHLGSSTHISRAETNKAVSQTFGQASFNDLQGKEHTLGEWKGKVLVVNFWATWCPPCRKEVPEFMAIQQKYAAQGLVIVGIGIDTKDKIAPFVEKLGVNYPVLLGERDGMKVSFTAGNVLGGMPYTVVLNRAGEIVTARMGALSGAQLEEIIGRLL
jgi:thiol-disulfide isomerase/thioredoxin